MANKQTAVDILVSSLPIRIQNMYASEIEDAKAMEKAQMIEFADSYGFDVCHFDYDRADEYYERTYENHSNKS
jgi:hypothetical protein